MTAEICILNRNGVALAADSAVTIGNQKVFNSANKLFPLSKFNPVGIMIYGNGDFMGVPWETIIKTYRLMIRDTKFDLLEEYSDSFINYLSKDTRFISPSSEKNFVSEKFAFFLNEVILEDTNLEIEKVFNNKVPTGNDIVKLIELVVDRNIAELSKLKNLDNFDDEFDRDFLDEYSELLKEIIDNKIKLKSETIEIKVNEILMEKLMITAILIFKKDLFLIDSGIVIAGFGDVEIFPRLCGYTVEGIVCNRLRCKFTRYRKIGPVDTNEETTASITPFAQQEMVHLFVEGIDPLIKDEIFNLLSQFTSQLPIITKAILGEVSGKVTLKPEDEEGIVELGENILNKIKNRVQEYQFENYIKPLLDAVSILPKEELASLAETLVNITSIKRKMSIDVETVGGPIDVAVITKGDGLVWIRRKHYFKPELNHVFFKNYLKGGETK